MLLFFLETEITLVFGWISFLRVGVSYPSFSVAAKQVLSYGVLYAVDASKNRVLLFFYEPEITLFSTLRFLS